jgi:transposase
MKVIKEGEINMDIDGFNKFNNVIKSFENSIIAIESTSTYHYNLLSFLISQNHKIAIINPALIKKFTQTITLRKTKTDKIDAVIIAKFICKNIEHINYFVPSNMDDIKVLARVREEISHQIAKVKNQFQQHLTITFPELVKNYNVFTEFMLNIIKEFPTPEYVVKTSKKKIKEIFEKYRTSGPKPSITPEDLIKLAKRSIGVSTKIYAEIVRHDIEMLKFFKAELKKISKEFIEEVNKNKKDEMEILKSIKGISDTTAAHFLSEIKEIERFENSKKLAAYAGIDPSIKESGISKQKGRITKKGSKSLRRYLYIMASSVMNCNGYFRNYYLKKREEGMPHRKAMIALCNKFLRVIFALLKKGECFDEFKYVKNLQAA